MNTQQQQKTVTKDQVEPKTMLQLNTFLIYHRTKTLKLNNK